MGQPAENVVPRGTPDIFDAPVVLRFVVDPKDRWHRPSDCGRYAISKADLGEAFERAHGYREVYDAWRRGKDGSVVPQNLGSFPIRRDRQAAFDAARERCQAHLEGRYTVPRAEVWKP